MTVKVYETRQYASALLIGSAGALILGLQPVLLGALINEKRTNFDQVAIIATVEMIAIGVGSVLFPAIFAASRMRLKATGLILLAALCHYLTADASSPGLIAMLRGAAGIFEGALLAVAVELLVRSDNPGRVGGWFVAIQTLLQSLVVLVLALWVLPGWASPGGFKALAVATLVLLAAIPLLPDDYGDVPASETPSGGHGTWRVQPLLALFAIFALYLFIGAIWAFLEPLGLASGLDAATVGLIVSVTLLVQVIGALVATWLEDRLSFGMVLGGAALAAVLIALGFANVPAERPFWILSLATGFIWLFVVPWQIAMTVATDPSRKTALLVPAAQLFGAALGPLGATAAMGGGQVQAVAWFAAGSALTSFFAVALLAVRRRSRRLS